MRKTPVFFILPPAVAAADFLAALQARADVAAMGQPQSCVKTYCDSFDARLYDAQLACILTRCGGVHGALALHSLQSGKLIACAEVAAMPQFAADIGVAELRDILREILEMRALLPVVEQACESYAFTLLDHRQKIVCRLHVEVFAAHACVHLRALRGFERALKKWSQRLQQDLGLLPAHPALALEVLRQHWTQQNRYVFKTDYGLSASMRADVAVRRILNLLLESMQKNWRGVIDATDSEFLHDYRIAVRKTRAALGQLRNIFPAAAVEEFRTFFAWLGQITGPVRDLDVYLLNFAAYKQGLPPAIREDLNPLYTFLESKQRQAQRVLAQQLQTPAYHSKLQAWQRFLAADAADPLELAPRADMPVGKFAAKNLSRVYRKVLRQGNAIEEDAPPAALHELRKSCKKLRYLLEFFQGLCPAGELSGLIKALKTLQDVLGNIQDYQVQEQQLRQFGEEMLAAEVPAAALLAMGVLIQHLDDLHYSARKGFARCFAEFRLAGQQVAFESVFTNKQ